MYVLTPQACLNAPEPQTASENGIDGENNVESPEDAHAQVPSRGIPPAMPTGYQMTPEQAQAMQYQYMRNQSQPGPQYQMPPGHLPPGHQQ
jgi:pheromone receptor transcription factor